jgi:hypothetical protein
MTDQAQVIDIKSRTDKTYTITLAGCEPRSWPYTKRTYRPTQLTVVKRDGNVSSVELRGPQVRKDGTDGSQWATERFYRYDERPAWLTHIIAGLA